MFALLVVVVLAPWSQLLAQLQAFPPTVSPKGSTVNAVEGSAALALTFFVTNNSQFEETFTTSCTPSGAVSGCDGPPGIDLQPGASTSVTVTYSTDAPGTGAVDFYVLGQGGMDNGRYNVNVIPHSYRVDVTPDAQAVTPAALTNASQSFTVSNMGNASAAYDLSVTCGPPAAQNCTAPASITLGAGAAGTVNVSYLTGRQGAQGTIRLRAGYSGNIAVQDDGSVSVAVGAGAAAPVVDISTVNPGPLSKRHLCLTTPAGRGGAYECGDLRIVHTLPTTRTLNVARTPALLYNSQFANPHPIVRAIVTLPASGAIPQTVAETLIVNGATRASGSWTGSDWTAGAARVTGLSFDASNDTTGLYSYTLKVVRNYTAGPQADSSSGELVIVNRKNSYYGAGWWLAGLERLVFAGGNRMVWIGGDGSAAVYRPVTGSANTWAAAATDRPDTLTYNNATLSYTRKLPHAAKVTFDRWGSHASTTDRRGKITTFAYASDTLDRRLASITLPGWGPGAAYTFYVNAGTLRLDSVVAPAPDSLSSQRTIRLRASSGRVVLIRDPSGDSVAFSYPFSDVNAIGTRTDRRGTVTNFTYGAALTLAGASIQLGTGASIDVGFRAQGIKGLAGGQAVSPDSAYTFIDGPRPDTDVRDYTRVWSDGQGSVVKIQNAMAQQTSLLRGDARFPGLVTEQKLANGLLTWAMYDARANLTTSSVVQPYGGPQNATTTYAWDPVWDYATRVTMPAGEVRSMSFDAATGNRLWDEDIRGGAFRTSYEYYASGVATGLLRAVVHPDGGRDSVAYDTLGNLRAVRSPLGNEVRYTNDRIGRRRVTKTQIDSGSYIATNWQDDSTNYDLMDRPTRVVSYGPTHGGAQAQSLIAVNSYDAEGNLKSTQRSISPELSNPLGAITGAWDYDAAGRKIREIAPDGMADSMVYNPAGAVIDWYTRRKDGSGARYKIHMVYDTLNRLTQRAVPQVDYPQRIQGIATLVGLVGLGAKPYGGFSIPASTTNYWYNVLGTIDSAANGDAKVKRRYFPNGQIQYDSLFIRWFDPASNAYHAYGLINSYDLDGRRTILTHPNQLAPRQGSTVYDVTRFAYDSATGLPVQITDPLGNRFAFLYNSRDALQTVTYPFDATGTEQFSYDSDGRLTAQTLANHDGQLRQNSYRYDASGKVIASRNGVMMKDTVTSSFSGLGYLTYTRARFAGVNQAGQSVAKTVISTFQNDALGDVTNGTDTSFALTSSGWGNSSLYTGGNWWTGFVKNVGRLSVKSIASRNDLYVYDSAGNVEFSYAGYVDRSVATPPPDEDRASFYSADGQLRVADYRIVAGHKDGTAESALWKRVVEYYRYDPLGRRILVRTYRTCDNMDAENCRMSTIRRTVWDGDKELYEMQMPGDSLEAQSWVENDTAYVDDRVDNATAHGYFDQNPYFGRVAYTEGMSVDQPLGIIRMQYASHPSGKSFHTWGRFSMYPHWSARGEADLGSLNNGNWNYCVTFADGMQCLNPWWYKGVYAYQREQNDRNAWYGTLVESKEDGAHTLYRRNRSYDPQSGHFTQEDPIGLAGGLNAYGYAAGDPTNFSDPSGLKLCFKGDSPAAMRAARETVEMATGTSISVDANGCATGFTVTARGHHRRFAAIQARLRVIIGPGPEVDATEGGAGFTIKSDGTGELRVENSPGSLKTKYTSCSGLGFTMRGFAGGLFSPSFVQSPEAKNIHELQHAYDFVTGVIRHGNEEQRGVDAEDTYSKAFGGGLRCYYEN